jgi:hypothetical protein
MLDMYVSNVLSLKRFHGAETGNTHECLLKLSIGRVRDDPANTKDLLDSRSVVYYAFILTFLFSQRLLIPLPISLLQHTPGPELFPCLVIYMGSGRGNVLKERKGLGCDARVLV